MVDLEMLAHRAPVHHAGGVTLLQGAALVGGDAAPEVHDGDHVDAAGEQQLHHRVAQQGPGGDHWNGPHAGDVTRLVAST
jgi:hypothetical protein